MATTDAMVVEARPGGIEAMEAVLAEAGEPVDGELVAVDGDRPDAARVAGAGEEAAAAVPAPELARLPVSLNITRYRVVSGSVCKIQLISHSLYIIRDVTIFSGFGGTRRR